MIRVTQHGRVTAWPALLPVPRGLALEPDAFFLTEAAPADFQRNMGKYWSGTQAYIEQGLRSGLLPAYTERACAGVKPLDKKLLITSLAASGLQTTASLAAVGTVSAAGAAAGGGAAAAGGAAAGGGGSAAAGAAGVLAAAAPFLIVGAVVLGVVGAIFAHHAKAVAAEQSTMCAAVPAANEALTWIDTEFKAGHIAKTDALRALDELFSNFNQYVQKVLKDEGNGQKCNLACGYRRVLQAIVAKKKAEIMEAPNSVMGLLSGDGWKGLLPWVAGAVLIWKVAA